ncbi:MAG: DUF6089 family protein [Bacteroidales bacterium]|nr:DUF6089 family protein [Bacteroidales bacterium]
MKKLIIVIFALFLLTETQSQTLEPGIFAGGSYYLGDLNPMYHFVQTQLALGLFIKYNFDSRWSFKFGGYRGSVKGDDAITKYYEERDLRFSTEIIEFSAIFELNFLDYFTGSRRNYMTPFIFGGASVFYFKPKLGMKNLKTLGTEGQNRNFDGREVYSQTGFGIPFGIGFKYSLSRRIGFTAEWGLRKTLTDYIDDVSTTYFLDSDTEDPNGILRYSDPNMDHKPYMQRGNSRTQDWYSFVGITLTYRIDLIKQNKCVDFQESNY